MNDLASVRDPSRFSDYLSDAYYAELVADFADWQVSERLCRDPAERDRFRGLLEEEARLLDRREFEGWLGLFVPACVYWVPASPDGGDPRREVAIAFDDRRRLEDRVFRLRSGHAWSQVPPSRTSRVVANVEVFEGRRAGGRMLRSTFLISEFWDGETRTLSGWAGHRVEPIDGRWKISAKQVNLLDCDQCIRNPSIIL